MINKRYLQYAAIAFLAFGLIAWLTWKVARPAQRGGEVAATAKEATIQTRPTTPGAARYEAGGGERRMMRGVVGVREVDAWTLRFATGKAARIWIRGADRARLDCVAQDAAGNLLDADAGPTGSCHLAWVPPHSGNYRIMIRNAGSVPTAYELVTR